MDDICTLTQKINKLESDHKDYVEFGARCFMGIFGTGVMIDHHHDPFLWGVLFILCGSLVAAIVIAVKKDLEKDQYVLELERFQADRSLVQAG